MTLAPDLRPEAPPDPAADERTSAARFVSHLHGLAEAAPRDGAARARLARLRQSIGRRGVDLLAFREIGEALPARAEGQDPDEYERMRDTYLLVGALFALHAAKSDKPWYGGYVRAGDSFGASCRRLKGGSGSMDLRFAALLDARRADLPFRLRQAVALLAAHDVGVRYDVLLRALLAWETPGRQVQRAWAADYWAPAARPSGS